MNKTAEGLDLTVLPEDAKRELIDFYRFLIKRYGKKGGKKAKYRRLVLEPLKVDRIVIPSRDELHER